MVPPIWKAPASTIKLAASASRSERLIARVPWPMRYVPGKGVAAARVSRPAPDLMKVPVLEPLVAPLKAAVHVLLTVSAEEAGSGRVPAAPPLRPPITKTERCAADAAAD